MVRMGAEALWAFLEQHFPQATEVGFRVEEVSELGVRLSWLVDERHLRPGGTVSGPVLMTLADTGAWLVILSRVGPVALAVTTSLEVHFLRRCPPGTLSAWSRIIKLGRRLAVVQVEICRQGEEEVVALATVTYALPE